MDRINTTNGLFSDGDPGNGVKGTLVTAAWLNQIQEELANIVEGFGGTLDPGQNDQLFKILSARAVMPGDEVNLSYEPTAQQMLDRRMLERDGSSLLRADYPGLFAVIGTMYGAVDSTHFNLPDDRGFFSRTWDHGAGVDPNAATRTNRGDGTTGNYVGTVQADELKSHRHWDTDPAYAGATVIQAGAQGGTAPNGYRTLSATGGSETRPKNRYKWGGIFY